MREENPGIPVLALDGGNFLGQPGVGGDLRSRLLLEAGATAGYDAINVGPREAARWAELPALAGDRKLPWVTTNVTLPAAEGAPPPPPAVREFTFGDMRLGVLGVAEPDGSMEAVTFRPTLQAVQSALAALKDPAERVIVIGRIPVTRAAVLSGASPRILAVLSGYGVMESESPLAFGPAPVAFCGEQGKSLIDMRLSLRRGPPTVLSYRLVPLDRTIPALPDWQSKLDATLKAVKEVEFDFETTEEPAAEGAAPAAHDSPGH